MAQTVSLRRSDGKPTFPTALTPTPDSVMIRLHQKLRKLTVCATPLLDSLATYRDNTQFQYDRVARRQGCATDLGVTQFGNPMPPACW